MTRDESQDLDRVNSFAEWCKRNGFSKATGRRILQSGNGPVVTRMSQRRFGIRERHNLEWLDRCAEHPA
jgi:hypothetical protein